MVYSGPLTVLVDRFSASPRKSSRPHPGLRPRLIVGTVPIGKGTVQTLYPLDDTPFSRRPSRAR